MHFPKHGSAIYFYFCQHFAMTKNTSAFAYFITFRTYGTWLHGDERSSTSRRNNQFGKPFITPWKPLHDAMKKQMNESPFILNSSHSQTVLQSLMDTCKYNHWVLYAAHVRANHAHIIVQSDVTKEKTMSTLKCYATKNLKKYHRELTHRTHFWSRNGSKKNIWAPESLFPALYYVVKQQGNPIALFFDRKYYDLQDEMVYETCFL